MLLQNVKNESSGFLMRTEQVKVNIWAILSRGGGRVVRVKR